MSMVLVMIYQNRGIKSISQHGRGWETNKPGMSYKNENSFSRWIIEKSDGLTMLGLQKLCDIEEIHYHKENQTNGGKQIGFSAESNHFEKKIKDGNK